MMYVISTASHSVKILSIHVAGYGDVLTDSKEVLRYSQKSQYLNSKVLVRLA